MRYYELHHEQRNKRVNENDEVEDVQVKGGQHHEHHNTCDIRERNCEFICRIDEARLTIAPSLIINPYRFQLSL